MALAGAICSLGLSGCNDDSDGAKVSAIGVKEAVYVSPIMQLSLKDNATLQLTPFIMPQNAANKAVAYSNLYPKVLEISADGLITPKAVGTDTITIRATDGSGVKVSYPVVITDHIVKATAINVTALGANMSIKIGNTFDLGHEVTLSPNDTWDTSVTYASSDATIATVDANGIVTAVAEGTAQITITTADGSNLTRTCPVEVKGIVISDVNYDRTGWTATVDPANAALNDATIGGNDAMYLLDDGKLEGKTAETCLGVAKPGRTAPLDGETTDFKVSFVIDMKVAQDIDYFILRHRSDNRTVALQVWEASFYGSNDGTTFTLIKAGAVTRAAGNNDPYTDFPNTPPTYTALGADDPKLNVKIALDATVNYRYIKMTYDVWNPSASGQMQIAEFNIGKTVIE
ncbi:hypothetical protein AGMMS49965_10040 [Bacteroidia bacterium]|nr:hypothetical protein AGMMS49965_10040 [Bacteroidia bacterium]